ncbi:MAG: histidine kinase [Bacteroidetes bacterium]|nr:histidine kinase [Bacteroidota bacterium]
MTIPSKYSPYFFIALLCLVIGSFRALVLDMIPWHVHLFAGIGQFIVMCAIWQLVALINRRLEKRFTMEQRPGTQITLQMLVTIILLSPVFYFTYSFVKPHLPTFITQRFLVLLIAVFVMIVMLMIFGYYTYNLFIKNKLATEEKARLQLEAAQLEKEMTMMQYHHLKNQVNPHFLFNTLTSLDGLIHSNPPLASDFLRHLSRVYRYVLEHKENEVVRLETEVDFIGHYISLLKIRYKEALEIELNISDAGREKGIVMVTLQMLIDNAVKHNSLQPGQPLRIRIWDEGDSLHVHNNRQLRRQIETSNRHGLKQLNELYAFLTPRPVAVIERDEYFEINLPLL